MKPIKYSGMKRIIMISLISAIMAVSCKNDLNIPNPNSPTTENFWKTSGDAQLGVNAIYSTFHRVGLCRNIHFMTLVRSDEGFSTSPNPDIVNTCATFHITDYNDGLSTSIWSDCYIGINRANQVLDNVPQINMDDQLRQQFIGEAKFLRGFFIIIWLHYMAMFLLLFIPRNRRIILPHRRRIAFLCLRQRISLMLSRYYRFHMMRQI
jgi:hypothetical protein